MQPTISIITPVYNHEQALHKALDSIAKQTYKDFEIVIVDDGSDFLLSSNSSSNVRASLSHGRAKVKHSPFRLIRQEHCGAPAARNRGFQESKGDYVIFWDADVVAKPDMLETMMQALAAHPKASYAYSNWRYGWKKMPALAYDAEALKKNNYINTASLIRRESVVPWDELLKRFQDWDFWLTLLERGHHGVWIPEYLYRALPHRGGISHWLPSFAYRAPWRYLPRVKQWVEAYEHAKHIVQTKHRISTIL